MSILSVAEAERLVAEYSKQRIDEPSHNGSCLNLERYTYIEPSAMQLLVKQEVDGFVFFGLKHLDMFTAHSLSKWEVYCCFSGLKWLQHEAAAELANGASGLAFEGLSQLSVETAQELAKLSNAQLSISLTGEFTLEMAEVLARHNHEMFLRTVVQPAPHVLLALLLSHEGYLATLDFPVNETPSSGIFNNQKKAISICTYHDEKKAPWAQISASEDIDSWLVHQ